MTRQGRWNVDRKIGRPSSRKKRRGQVHLSSTRWRRWGSVAACCTGLSLAPTGCGSPALPPGELAIANVRLVPVTGMEPDGPVTIRIRGDTIVDIEPTVESALAPGPDVIDGGGGYVLPGLVDAHVHVRESRELKLYVAAGVTTVRNMNGRFGSALAWRDSIRAGRLLGPRFVTASPTLFDGAPGYPYHVDGPEKARDLARRFHREGYDLIKVYRLGEPSVSALVDEASSLGIPVAGHIPLPDSDLERILELGFVSLEHLDEFVGPAFDGRSDYDRIPAVAERMVEAGVTVGTILSQWRAVNHGLDDPTWLLRDSLVERATHYFGEDGVPRLSDMADGMRDRTDEERDRDRSDFDFLLALVAALNDRGVNIVAGTDAHQVLAPAGEGLWNELDILVEAGLSPLSALRAATLNPARLMNEVERAGSVEVGKRADLLLLMEDPSEDLRALRRPGGVMLRGEWLDRDRLDELVEEGREGGGASRTTG